MLEGRKLYFSYSPGNYVVEDVSIQVKRGRITALLGPNGSGKTTLILLVSGLLKPLKGEVYLEGRNLFELLPEARRNIGVVFQNPDDHLFNPTVLDELLFTLNQLNLAQKEREERVQHVAKLLNLNELLRRPIHALSYGEKRRVALASVLVYDPQYLLLDEPTANLDPKTSAVVISILCGYKKTRGVLLATQDVWLAESISDYMYILSNGRVAWEGAPPAPRDVLDEVGLGIKEISCKDGAFNYCD
ncbi:MAG: energy-coupling factor ABC transporter ATP-binding protein [Thermofilum sp.]|nr:energy-coupling factor ABC transporter ATP-binding protein [Thermofilum sp.]